MLGETENQFSLTRGALSTVGRAKSKFLSVDEPTDVAVVARRRAPDMFRRMRLCSVLFVALQYPPPAIPIALAMESNEQLAYEELRWFDKYVK